MAVRAKFYVAEVAQFANQATAGYAAPAPRGTMLLRNVTRGEENREWASATPQGELRMTVNGDAWPWFQQRLGSDVILTMEDAPTD